MFPEFEALINEPTGDKNAPPKITVHHQHEHDLGQHSSSRINTSENFEKYFQIAIPPKTISNRVIDNVIANLSNKDIIISGITNHSEEDLFLPFLSKLESILQEKIFQNVIEIEGLKQFLIHVVVFSDGKKEEIIYALHNFFIRIARSVRSWYSDNEADELFEFVSSNSDNFEFLSRIFRHEDYERNNKSAGDYSILTKEAFQKLQDKLLLEVIKMRDINLLLDRKDLNKILYMWKNIDPNGTFENWINKEIESIEKFLKIMYAFVNDEDETKFYIGDLKNVFDIEFINKKIQHFHKSNLNPDNKKLLDNLKKFIEDNKGGESPKID